MKIDLICTNQLHATKDSLSEKPMMFQITLDSESDTCISGHLDIQKTKDGYIAQTDCQIEGDRECEILLLNLVIKTIYESLAGCDINEPR